MVLGADLTQIGWHFMPTGRRGMGDPVECLAAALRRGPHTRTDLPACAVWACLALASVCASYVHGALSEGPSRALGHVLRPHGHRTHAASASSGSHTVLRASRVFSVLTLAAALLCGFSHLSPGRAPLQLSTVLSICTAGDTGCNGKAMGLEGRLLLVQIPGCPPEYLPHLFKFTRLRF